MGMPQSKPKPLNKWFTPAQFTLKSVRRHIESLWYRTRFLHQLKRFFRSHEQLLIIDAYKEKLQCFFSLLQLCQSSQNLERYQHSPRSQTYVTASVSIASFKSLSQVFATVFFGKILIFIRITLIILKFEFAASLITWNVAATLSTEIHRSPPSIVRSMVTLDMQCSSNTQRHKVNKDSREHRLGYR